MSASDNAVNKGHSTLENRRMQELQDSGIDKREPDKSSNKGGDNIGVSQANQPP